MNTELIAAILVGGKGTRLRSVISDVPKPLAPIAGEPFLYLVLRDIAALGIKRVILLTGYMHEKIVAACGNGSQFGLDIQYSQETESLGTAGALKLAEPFLSQANEFILLNGDTYLECSLKPFLETPLEQNTFGVIGATRPLETARFGTLEIDPISQTVLAFREKDAQSTGLVSAGIYKFATSILNHIPAHQALSLESDIFPTLIEQGLHLKAFTLQGEFFDIGVPESYADFNHKWSAKSKEAVHA